MLSDFISLFFPRYCVGCHNALSKNEPIICITCQHELPKTNSHSERPNFVEQKFYGKIRLSSALAYYKYESKSRIQQIMQSFKYKGQPEIGVLLGKWYGLELKEYEFDSAFDMIIPVPLHKMKLRRRGFNQSTKFAEGLSESMGIPVETKIVKRQKMTATQTKKSRLERWENVEHIFEVIDRDKIVDKRVLLVDDVITTGSTIESCASTLLSVGAQSVGVGAIAAAV